MWWVQGALSINEIQLEDLRIYGLFHMWNIFHYYCKVTKGTKATGFNTSFIQFRAILIQTEKYYSLLYICRIGSSNFVHLRIAYNT